MRHNLKASPRALIGLLAVVSTGVCHCASSSAESGDSGSGDSPPDSSTGASDGTQTEESATLSDARASDASVTGLGDAKIDVDAKAEPSEGGAPVASIAPLAAPATAGTGAHLVTVGSASRLELNGVTVWGIPDFVTTTFGASQYANRDAVTSTIAGWNGNVIRLRVLADEYENPTNVASQAAYLQMVKDWVTAAEAHGLYVQICWWDSLDSTTPQPPRTTRTGPRSTPSPFR